MCSIVDADEEGGTIVINNPDKSGTRKAKKRRFTFDFVFDEQYVLPFQPLSEADGKIDEQRRTRRLKVG